MKGIGYIGIMEEQTVCKCNRSNIRVGMDMKYKLRSIINMNSLFVKLMAGFIFVILLMCSFYTISYKVYVSSIEIEIVKNESEKLNRLVNSIENYINNLYNNIVRFYVQSDIQNIMKNDTITHYDLRIIRDAIRPYTNDIKHVSTFFLFTPKTGYIITPTGTIKKDMFFGKLYTNDVYTEDFWNNEINSQFSMNIYPAGYYINESITAKDRRFLVPVAFKNMSNDLMIIALVDMHSVTSSIEGSFVDALYILNSEKEWIYPGDADIDILNLKQEEKQGYTKIDSGYLIARNSASGFHYFKIIGDEQIKKQFRTTSLLLLIMFSAAFGISLIISVCIVVKVNNPVKQIWNIIKKSGTGLTESNLTDLKVIREYIQTMDTKNSAYREELSSKDSILQKFFYQTKMKNVYSYISQLKHEISINNEYFICYFKVHYRECYYKEISFNTNMGTFYLKELIQMYIESYFSHSVTFHMEEDQIISIINIEPQNKNVRQNMTALREKLKSEEEYVFFTIIISKNYQNISELDTAFNNLIRIMQHRALTSETQFIEEENFKLCNRKLSFNLEQAKQIWDLLMNGEKDLCIQQMEKVLDNNYRQGTDAFYISLVCHELINCCAKCLVEIYHDVPDEIDIEGVFSRISMCSVIDEYKKVCFNFATDVAGYIATHKRKRDYIVDYVKEYIEANYHKDFSLDLLASNLNVTRVYLSIYYKNKTGVNLSDYIRSYRIEKAKSLLENTSKKINDISNEVGIPNVNTFIRLFKSHTGITPSEFRRNLLNQAPEIS